MGRRGWAGLGLSIGAPRHSVLRSWQRSCREGHGGGELWPCVLQCHCRVFPPLERRAIGELRGPQDKTQLHSERRRRSEIPLPQHAHMPSQQGNKDEKGCAGNKSG